MSMQTLRNWLKASEAGKLNGAGAKVVTAEQMELSRLRAENKRLQMEVLQQFRVNGQISGMPHLNGTLEADSVPEHDRGGHEVQAACAIALRLEATITDFA